MVRQIMAGKASKSPGLAGNLLLALALTVFIISAAVVLVLNSKWLYYIDIFLLGLEKRSGMSADTISANYADGETVSLETLKEKGIVKGVGVQVKVLSNGSLTKKVAFEGVKMSQSAKAAVEAAGCSVK